jgi:hypothetical protein
MFLQYCGRKHLRVVFNWAETNIFGWCYIVEGKKNILGWCNCNGDILRGIKTLMLQLIEFNTVRVENILGWFCIGA